MGRNRDFARAICVWVLATLALLAAASLLGDVDALPWIAATSLAAGIPFIIHTRRRYRLIAQLSNRVDAVLHGAPLMAPAATGRPPLELILAIYTSARTGRTVTF